ncbi:MAG: PAS domain S-box protein [Nitrospirae bacterium]|nr:MAG: PAS domain S-box protein [Nitrospirota bacterium]
MTDKSRPKEEIAIDIADRKKAEDTLKKSEEKYRMLIENIQDGVFIIQDAKIKFSNEAFAKMLGYTSEELVGMDIRKLIAPEDLDMVMGRYQKRLAGKDVPREYEFQMLHKSGGRRVIVNMLVGLVDYQGKTASMGTVKDVTEHKLMEAEIQKTAGGIAHDFNNVLTAIIGNVSLAKMYAKPGLEVFDILTELEKAALRAKKLTAQLLAFSKGGTPSKELTSIPNSVKNTAAAPAVRGKGKVLVMDDDDTVRLVVGRMLGQCGYEAEFAEDGGRAIELYRKAKESGKPFDAVIIDLIIPEGMGGKEAVKKLIEIDSDIRAIVSSGYSDDLIMSGFQEYGFKGALAKPFEISELSLTLHKVISGI